VRGTRTIAVRGERVRMIHMHTMKKNDRQSDNDR
jgi:hypothetical protein